MRSRTGHLLSDAIGTLVIPSSYTYSDSPPWGSHFDTDPLYSSSRLAIVHDWLFVMQDCQLPGFEDWTVDEAAHVMSEVMKTLMEKPGFDYGDEATIYRMYLAVQSPPARQAWEDRNCQSPPSPTADGWRADAKFVIEF